MACEKWLFPNMLRCLEAPKFSGCSYGVELTCLNLARLAWLFESTKQPNLRNVAQPVASCNNKNLK